MKVLDVFCGRWGWSKGFASEGFEVVGIDIEEHVPPLFSFIKADIRTLNPLDYQNFDVIIGSPPCVEFSVAKRIYTEDYKPQCKAKPFEGLKLVYAYLNFVDVAKPKIWAMENVLNMINWYKIQPKLIFKISKRGFRGLWGNFKPFMMPDFSSKRRLSYELHPNLKIRASIHAEIPFYISKVIAQEFKSQLEECVATDFKSISRLKKMLRQQIRRFKE